MEISTNGIVGQSMLFARVRHVIQRLHYSIRTEQCYLQWIKRFILFHNKKHPDEMGTAEVEQFLTYLAVKLEIAASTQNQALNAIVFLYKQVLKRELGEMANITRAKRPQRLPTVFSKDRDDASASPPDRHRRTTEQTHLRYGHADHGMSTPQSAGH